MANKNQILVFIISFLIAGFFLLSIPDAGFSGLSPEPGGPPCCEFTESCAGNFNEGECGNENGAFFPNKICPNTEGFCVEPPSIPTLNQYGMIIMAAVLGLFAVIGLFIMRRNVVKPSG